MIELRSFKESDCEAIAQLLNNPNVARYMSSKIPFPYTTDDAKWFIDTGSKIGYNKVISFHGELAGVVGVAPGKFEYCRSGEIGYWVGEKFWGNGIATKAVALFSDHVFETTDIVRLVGPVFGPNHASMRVLEKCGFIKEAIQRNALYKGGQFYDAHIYAKLHSYR